MPQRWQIGGGRRKHQTSQIRNLLSALFRYQLDAVRSQEMSQIVNTTFVDHCWICPLATANELSNRQRLRSKSASFIELAEMRSSTTIHWNVTRIATNLRTAATSVREEANKCIQRHETVVLQEHKQCQRDSGMMEYEFTGPSVRG